MTILLDPADADNFRMTKDYGRWYIDPLPACDIADATDAQWPSFTEVGRAADQDWSFLVTPRMAAIEPDELRRIAGLERSKRLEAFRSHEKDAKQCAFGRGSIIHLWKEDLLAGRAPREITDEWLFNNKYPAAALEEARAYLPAILDFFDVYQPEPVLVEYVTIHRTLNGHGYGCTPDAIIRIEGEDAAVDWKTRSESSKHAAYPKELKQVAAGLNAEYMIVRDGGEARRAHIPKVSAAYVVSIKTDGARLYPLEVDRGWRDFQHLHEWWTHTLDDRDGIKRVLPARRKIAAPVAALTVEQPAGAAAEDTATPAISLSVPAGAPPGEASSRDVGSSPAPPPAPSFADQRKRLLARHAALTPAQKRQFKERGLHPADLEHIAALLDELENPPTVREMAAAVAEVDTDGEPTCCDMSQGACGCKPDEGPDVDEATWQPVVAAANNLPAPAKAWCGRLFTESRDAGVTFHRASAPTLRRYELYRGLVKLALWLSEDGDNIHDDTLTTLVHAANAVGNEQLLYRQLTPGHALGSLNHTEAARFAQLVDRLVAGDIGLTVRPDGTMEVAA